MIQAMRFLVDFVWFGLIPLGKLYRLWVCGMYHGIKKYKAEE